MKKAVPQPMLIPTHQGVFPIKEEDIKKYLVRMPRKDTEIVFFGSDPWSIHVLKALEDNFDVKLVVTAPDSAVATYFRGPILTPDKLDNEFLIPNYQLLTTQLFIVASYGKIIPKTILDIPKYGALNIHPSLLPKYRGPSPVPATILNGDKITGVTIIKMDEKMDHGPVVVTKRIILSGKEDFTTLINLLFQEGAELLVKIIPDFIQGRIRPKQQNHKDAIYCPLLKKGDGFFDISSPPNPEKLDKMIRAYYPWPGVWTKWNRRIIKFLPISSVIPATCPERSRRKAGIHTNKFLIQMEGGKPTPLKVFLNNYPDFPIYDGK